MKIATLTLFTTGAALMHLSAAQPADHLVFPGKKGQPGNGKHIVFMAGDEEYRSEEAMPMMAQIMADQGFKCTVLFSMDAKNKYVDPKNQKSLSNSAALDSADAIMMSLRFRNYNDKDMGKFVAAFERGVPMVALRTSTHAFKFAPGSKYAKYSTRTKPEDNWKGGFGKQVLGETWVSHHGAHKKQGTLTFPEKENAKHPVLNGVAPIFAKSDVYGANPLAPSTILLRGAVTESLDPKSKPIAGKKNNPMMPVAWVREYKHANGKTNRVFTTTMGSADDLVDENLRRLVINGVYWGLDMKVPAKADASLKSKFKPSFYGFGTFLKNQTPSDLMNVDVATSAKSSSKKSKKKKPKAAAFAPVPFEVLTGPKHPAAKKGAPPKNLTLAKNSRIGFVGGGLGSRMNIFNEFETELQRRYPEHNLYIRNLCKECDTPAFRPHPSRRSHWVLDSLGDKGRSLMKKEYQSGGGNGHYDTPDQWLTRHGVDTVIGFFGYSESFDGTSDEQVKRYKEELRAFIKHTLAAKYTKNGPQLAIVSPAAFEDLSAKVDLPNGNVINRRLAIYSKAMAEVCKEEGVLFYDTFSAMKGLYDKSDEDLTSNGHNLNEAGYRKLSPLLAEGLFGKATAKNDYAKIKAAVAEKNRLWILDYKIPNGVHVHGRRYRPYGNVNYPGELKKVIEMTEIRDQAIWAASQGKSFDVAAADAKTHKLMEIKTNSNRPNVYKSGKEVEKLLKVAPGFKVELFACEKSFPDLQNPSQMAFDNKGRLWVGCMGSYPHYRIGDPLPNDKIIILEDTDNDGKADKQINFVENIHIPMGFEITEHGVFVSLGNDLVLLKDTDGDSKADTKEYVISGFDDHDTHHAISSFCADPSGAFYLAEGVFSHSNVETPYGPVRGTNGGFYRYNPTRKRLERSAQYKIPNPWGIAFNDWGQNFFLHTSGTKFSWMQRSAVKPRYNVNLDAPSLITSNAVRPTSGVEFVSSRHFPDEMQGDFLLCNTIGFLGCKQHKFEDDPETGFFKSSYRQDLFVSPRDYQYFRPVDLEFAPDGSLFFIDWSNVLIGHMQHNARDPKRDHVHGRVYRVTYPSRPLVKPAKIDGAPIATLLENLKEPEIRTRYRTRRELRGRDADKVAAATAKWAAGLDKSDPRYEHHILEALWVTWGINKIDIGILEQTLKAKDYRARTAAVRAIRYNADKLSKAADYLMAAAADPHAQVRHEAVIQASWMGKRIGLPVIAEAKKLPISKWSQDAFKNAESNLNNTPVDIEDDHNKVLPKGIVKNTATETTVQINCIVEGIKFDVKDVKIQKGKKVKIIFNNPDVMQHNLLVVNPGSADEIAKLAMSMGADGFKKQFNPQTKDVLLGSKLLNEGEKEVLEITFTKPGKYPFICTFPGHAQMMRGHFIVK